jgi:chemotaxis protein histidine kinase CheA
MTDSNGNHAVLQAFLGEARERLAAVGRKLDALASRPGNAVLWNAICRDFHAVTRGAAFFDVTALLELCQAVDALFDELRDGRSEVSAELRGVIASATGAVAIMIEDIAHDHQPLTDGALLAKLRDAAAALAAHRVWQ